MKIGLHPKTWKNGNPPSEVFNRSSLGFPLKVKVRTVDGVFDELKLERIHFLKIDVESFESDVLQGSSVLLGDKKIDYILFELQETLLNSIQRTPKEVCQILFEPGYQIIDLNGNLMQEQNHQRYQMVIIWLVEMVLKQRRNWVHRLLN